MVLEASQLRRQWLLRGRSEHGVELRRIERAAAWAALGPDEKHAAALATKKRNKMLQRQQEQHQPQETQRERSLPASSTVSAATNGSAVGAEGARAERGKAKLRLRGLNPEVFLKWAMLSDRPSPSDGPLLQVERIQLSPRPFRTARVRATGDVQGQDCHMIFRRLKCSVAELQAAARASGNK